MSLRFVSGSLLTLACVIGYGVYSTSPAISAAEEDQERTDSEPRGVDVRVESRDRSRNSGLRTAVREYDRHLLKDTQRIHLTRHAAKLLEQAGDHELAKEIRERADQLEAEVNERRAKLAAHAEEERQARARERAEREPSELHQVVDDLRHEVAELREEIQSLREELGARPAPDRPGRDPVRDESHGADEQESDRAEDGERDRPQRLREREGDRPQRDRETRRLRDFRLVVPAAGIRIGKNINELPIEVNQGSFRLYLGFARNDGDAVEAKRPQDN